MYCIDENTYDIVGTRGIVSPCSPRYGPADTWQVHSCEIRRAQNVEPLLRIERTQLR